MIPPLPTQIISKILLDVDPGQAKLTWCLSFSKKLWLTTLAALGSTFSTVRTTNPSKAWDSKLMSRLRKMSVTFAMSKRYILLSKMWRNTYSWPRSLPDFCRLSETMRDCAEHETDSDKKKYKLPNRQIFVEQISQCQVTKVTILRTRQTYLT